MKKIVNLLALGILLGVEVLTPITYAQEVDDLNIENVSVPSVQTEDDILLLENDNEEIDEIEENDRSEKNNLDGEAIEFNQEDVDDKIEKDIEKLEGQTLAEDNAIINLLPISMTQRDIQLQGEVFVLGRTLKDGEINNNKATELIKIIGWLDDFGVIEKQGPDDGVIKVLSGKLLFEMRELDNSGYFIKLGDDVTFEDSIHYYLSDEEREHMTGYSEYNYIELSFLESSYITFDMNGHGEQQEQIIVLTGHLPKKPNNPSVEGYVFKGWYTTPSCEEGTKYNFNTRLSGDITLYAKRRDISEGYKITFDMNGHGEQSKPVYGFPGEFPEEPDIPSTDGYVFRGWYTTPSCGKGTKYNFDAELTGDITLYAKWSECGDGFKVMDNKCVQDSIEGVIKVTNGVDTVYVKDRNQGAEISYGLPPQLYIRYLSILVDNGDMTPEEADEEIILYTNNTLGTSFTGVEEVVYYLNLLDSFNDLYSTGNKYIKSLGTYYYRGNNSGAEYDELNIDLNNMRVDIPNELRESGFSGGKIGINGEGRIDGNINPCDASKGEYLPTREDWKEVMEIWANDKGFDVMTESRDENNEIFIVDDNGGNMERMIWFSQDMLIPYNLSIGLENHLNSPGLWTSQNKTGEIGIQTYQLLTYNNANKLSVQNINSFAMSVRCFVKLQDAYLVTYDSNEGSEVRKQNVVSGNTINQPESPTRGGYTFDGWYKDDGLTEKWDFDNDVVTDDVTLYAKWIENKPSGGSSGGGGGGGSSKSDNSKEEKKSEEIPQSNVSTGESVKEPEEMSSLPDPQNDKQDPQDSQKAGENFNKSPEGQNYTLEFQQAYQFAKDNGITTMPTIQKAQMNSPLTRIAMAKMLSQYAINVLGKTPDISKNNKFNDVSDKKDADYNNGVTLAYQLGIMGQNMPNNNFRPDDEVTRAEFVAALSRMLYNTSDGEYKSTSKYYTHHMEKLKSEGIVTNTNPTMKEKRGYVMIMLMRSVK